MKRAGFILLMMVVFLYACSDKNKLPEGVLPQPKMQAVMWDVIRAGDFLNNYVFYKDPGVDKVAESEKWNKKIFQMHKITREQFEASYTYYQQHPQLMKVIMDSISKIKVEQVEPPKPAFAPGATIDSVKKKMDSVGLRNKINRIRRLGSKKPAVQ